MKRSLLLFGLLSLFILQANAQSFRPIDVTPMDLAYYPDRYPENRKFDPAKIGTSTAMIRVLYSRPARKGRRVFGTLAPFGQVWRAGANEAPEIKFYRDATVGGKKIRAGLYQLLLIPGDNEWTVIFNTDLDQWGAYSYDPKLDVARVRVPVQQSAEVIENFSIQFAKKADKKAIMYIGWDRTVIAVPIAF